MNHRSTSAHRGPLRNTPAPARGPQPLPTGPNMTETIHRELFSDYRPGSQRAH